MSWHVGIWDKLRVFLNKPRKMVKLKINQQNQLKDGQNLINVKNRIL